MSLTNPIVSSFTYQATYSIHETRPQALPWFGVRTKSNQEQIACTLLTSKGFQAFLPTYTYRRRRWDRIVESARPLFPGYLFCKFDVAGRLPIITTPGVVSILGIGNDPAPIPDSEIEAVQTIVGSGAATEPCPFLQEGQHIRITSGALEGIEGILTKKKNEYRLVISVTILHRSVSVEIDSHIVSTV